MLSNMKLKTYIVVLFLLFLFFAVIATTLGLINLHAVMTELNALTTQDAAVQTAIQGVEQSYINTLFAVAVCAALTVILAIFTYVFLNRHLLRPLSELQIHFEAIANGDLSQRNLRKNSNEVGQVFDALRRLQENLTRTFSAVRNSVVKINHDADQMASGNTSLSTRIEQQAAALQQTATSMEQLASTVRQNADNAYQANQLATTASSVAQRGGHAVSEVVSTMQDISASSSKITDIVGVIDSIAFQTNILALNAAVEAARAGEQGRGFAVVASEVRALAQRSAQAAREITALIEDSVAKVSEGSGQVERAGATMQEIVDSVKRVTDIMGEISAATIEQSSGIDQVNLAVHQLDVTTLQNAQMVEQSARSAADMSAEVQVLSEALTFYRLPDSQQIATKTQPVKAREPVAKKPTSTAYALAESRKKASDIPGMNTISNAAKEMKLLRPDLKANKNKTVEDDWVEF